MAQAFSLCICRQDAGATHVAEPNETMNAKREHNWRGYLFVAPATAYLAVFAFFPMVFAGLACLPMSEA